VTLRVLRTASCLLGLSLSGCADAPRPDALALDAGAVDAPRATLDAPAVVDAPVAVDVPARVDLSAAPDAQGPADAGDGYPAGPYGTAVGQVLGDMRLEGFVNPTAEGLASARPYVSTSMAALRGRGRGYGVVFVAEFL